MSKSVYSSFKFFHYADKMQAFQQDRWTAPLHVRLKPTNVCNHRCWYCGYQHQNDLSLGMEAKPKDLIPRAKMLELCGDFVSLGVKAVTLTGGGEPLTYPFLEEAVQLLHQGGVQLALLTNGSLLAGERAKVLADRLAWVRVSMDGYDDASYMRYRGVKDQAFSRIIENLRSFAAIKGRTVLSVALNLDVDNVAHLPDMVPLLKSCGVQNVKLAGCVVSDEPDANSSYHRPHFERTKALIGALQGQLNDQNFELVDRYHLWAEQNRSYARCGMLGFLTVVAADQAIYTCQDKAYHPSGFLGSIADAPFREVWFSSALQERAHALDPRAVCRHHCVSHGKNTVLAEFAALDPEHLAFV